MRADGRQILGTNTYLSIRLFGEQSVENKAIDSNIDQNSNNDSESILGLYGARPNKKRY